MRLVVIAALAGMMWAPIAPAQKLDLKFDALAAKASDKAEVDLDGALLRLATRHAKAEARGDFLGDLKEIHVRHYEFDKAGSYSDQDLAPLRKQVSESAGWSRILNVKEKDETTEIFVLTQGGKIGSCLILSAEAKRTERGAHHGHTDAGADEGTGGLRRPARSGDGRSAIEIGASIAAQRQRWIDVRDSPRGQVHGDRRRTASRITSASKQRRIPVAHSDEVRGDHLPGRLRPGDSRDQPEDHRPHSLARHQPLDAARRGPEGDPYAALPRAL